MSPFLQSQKRRSSTDAACGGVVAEPVRAHVEGDDDGSVREPVEHRGGDDGISEDLACHGRRHLSQFARQDSEMTKSFAIWFSGASCFRATATTPRRNSGG